MSATTFRIFSDLHYGDPASRLKTLGALRPLFAGASALVLNGDTLDTRPSEDPAGTESRRKETEAFFNRAGLPVRWINGNHDPDISAHEFLELAGREVFVTHGDGLFEDVVPWSQDAELLRQRRAAELAALDPERRGRLDDELKAVHRAAAMVPQRHQTERNGFKYAIRFAADTVWPPGRILKVLRARRETPARAERMLAAHGLPARFFVMGHTHKHGVMRGPDGLTVLNTGSFCFPSQAAAVDVTAERIVLRAIVRKRDEFGWGAELAEFPLAAG